MQAFLLELGRGFAFVGRQLRLTLDGDHFYPDLVFYHVKLKCYVVIDLKVGKLAHGDLVGVGEESSCSRWVSRRSARLADMGQSTTGARTHVARAAERVGGHRGSCR
jgi:hypothetical protein